MNKRSLAALIALNVLLLVALAVTLATPEPAQAQFGAAGRQYLMIAGEVAGRSSQAAVYIIDTQSTRMVAVLFNSNNNTFEFVAGRTVGDDVAAGAPRR
jgi:hypothetical protein